MGRKDKAITASEIKELPIGASMRLSRQERRIPLTKMARLVNYSQTYLSRVENGKLQPSLEMVERYEKILGLQNGELATLLQSERSPLQALDEQSFYQQQAELLEQGVESWNHWRETHPEIRPSLSRSKLHAKHLQKVNLNGADLTRIELSEVDLSEADLDESILRQGRLSQVTLTKANLSKAFLSGVNFFNVNLSEANLSEANLSDADLSGVNLRNADLSGTNLSGTNLSKADLEKADLSRANLTGANLTGANLSHVMTAGTIFGDVDLRQVRGLETICHLGPSTIGVDAINRSNGEIPEVFLRGAGLPDVYMEFIRSLRARSIDYYTCFISYARQDQSFAERLYTDLTHEGIRCWFAPHDMRVGDHIRLRSDEAIRQYDKLILLLSEHSIAASWIENEVEATLEKEQLLNRPVLLPCKLDNTVMRTSQAWAADIRRTRNIGDFTAWKEYDNYKKAFGRLLRDLKAMPKFSVSLSTEKFVEEAISRWIEGTMLPDRQVDKLGTKYDTGPDLLFTSKEGENIGVEVKYYTHPKKIDPILPIVNKYIEGRAQPKIDKLLLVYAFPEELSARDASSRFARMENVPPTVSLITGYIQNGEFRRIASTPESEAISKLSTASEEQGSENAR